MPRLLRAKGWGLIKPPPGTGINWGHPLAQGLVAVCVLNEGGGPHKDAAFGSQYVFTEVGGTPLPVWNPQAPVGMGLTMVGTQNQPSPTGSQLSLPAPPRILRITQHVTAHIAFNMSAAAAANTNADNPVVIANDGSAGPRPWDIDVSVNKLRWFAGGASLIGAANSYTGGPVVATGVYDAQTLAAVLYKNGIALSAGSGTGVIATSTYDLTLGFRNFSSNTGHWSGQISYAYVWDRALGPADVQWLFEEPYAFFTPPAATRSGILVSSSITVTAARGFGRGVGRPATSTATTPVTGARGFGRAFARPVTITASSAITGARGVGRAAGRAASVTGSASVTGARGTGRAAGRPAMVITGIVVPGARGVGRAFGRPVTVTGSASVTGARGQGRAAGRPASVSTSVTVTGARATGRAVGRPAHVFNATTIPGARGFGRATGRHASITTSSVIRGARGSGRGVGRGATITVPVAPGVPAAYGIPAYGVPPYAGGAPSGAGPSLFDVSATASVVVTSKASAFQIHPPPEPVPGPFGLHDYEVIVVDKYGIAQGQIVSAVPTQIDWVLNDLGQALIDFYILDPSALLLPLTVLPGAREIQIWRDQVLIWWGWPTSVTYDAKQVHLTCSGLLFPYSKRSFGPITTNYLLNADFELPATLNVIPDWTAINCVANVTPANAVASPLLNSFMAQLQQPVPGEDAYIRQYVNVTDGGPGGGEGTFYDLSAWVYIDPTATFAPAFGQNGIFIQFIELLTVVAGPEIQQITVDTGAGQWVRLECGVEVPPNASGVLEIRLYAPQGVTYWDACRLTVQESVGSSIAGDDVQFIMEQIVTYAQDATRAKSDLAMPFAGPATGTVLERVYQFSDNSGILDALNEFPTIGVCDFEVTWDVTGHFRQFQIFPPAKGEVKYNYPITIDIPSTTDLEGGIDGTLVATTSRVLGQGSTGSSQDLGWAAFPSALGGRVALDGIFTQGSNIIQSATIGFTVDDIGEGVYCQTAGVLPIGSTIDSIVDSNTATFTSNQGGGALLNANAVLGIGGIVLDDVESALPDLPIGTLQGTAEGIVLRQSQAQFLPTARQRADGPNGLFGNVSTGDVVPVMFNYGWLTYGPVLMRVATLSLYPPTEELEVQLNVVPIGENAYG